MLSLPKIYMCLGLTALLILRASGQRNRYSNNNDNNNNRNGGYSSGSTQVGDISSPEEEGKIECTAVYFDNLSSSYSIHTTTIIHLKYRKFHGYSLRSIL